MILGPSGTIGSYQKVVVTYCLSILTSPHLSPAIGGKHDKVAVVLNTEGMSAQHLYVAMTRGSMKLVVCGASPLEKILSTPSLLACHLPLTSIHEEAGKTTEKPQNRKRPVDDKPLLRVR